MALVPPPNTAGVILPANPQNPPTLDDITNSKEYVERLALSKRNQVYIPADSANRYTIGSQIPGATATDNDIGGAEKYHQDIVITNTMMAGAPGPPWLQQFMAAPPPWMAQFMNNVNQDFACIHQNFARIEAWQINAGISRLNKLEMESNSGVIAYRAKQKVIEGDGILLANAVLPANFAPIVALQDVPAVGTTIAPTISPNTLTHHAILSLIQYYNFDFGIQQNELATTRCQRILNWLTTDV